MCGHFRNANIRVRYINDNLTLNQPFLWVRSATDKNVIKFIQRNVYCLTWELVLN